MIMLTTCYPETMACIQRWLLDSLRASLELKRSHDVRRESSNGNGNVTLHPVTLTPELNVLSAPLIWVQGSSLPT